MPFVNPYNFVRPGPTLQFGPARGQRSIEGFTGSLTCRLEVHTPIFTPQFSPGMTQSQKTFFRSNDRPALPATSLKGMIRNLAEALSNGCSPFNRRPLSSCRSLQSLCLCCRLFGFLDTTSGSSQGGAPRVHTGQVAISDGHSEEGWEFGEKIWLKELSSPKPERHTPFYEEAARSKSRKFYYHQHHIRTVAQIPRETRSTGRNVNIEPLLQGSFTFNIRYRDLLGSELGLLLHSLQLPSGFYHKFGMGKPLGLGTVRIEVIGMTELDSTPASRYQQYDLPTTRVGSAGESSAAGAPDQQALQEHIKLFQDKFAGEFAERLGQQLTGGLWTLAADNLDDLKIILREVHYSEEIEYPGYAWFKDKYPSHTLPSIQEVHAGARLPD